ncbi:Leucine Rich Repeat [Seminavis robusta]|uniref:Leucine Rich Repeat n=1 Tax=Seminavis robusta TaxID=568900 RepID=A0A9N8DAG3_9STRA|nr:Leucine Rich Repeat [Seminavis robusta]|eukprot:Sro52_g031210.1 Leucine Rich Repeat (777) ;mRNA; f:135961-138425
MGKEEVNTKMDKTELETTSSTVVSTSEKDKAEEMDAGVSTIKDDIRRCENTGIAEVLKQQQQQELAEEDHPLESSFVASIEPLPSVSQQGQQGVGPGAFFTNAHNGHLTPAGKTPLNVLGAELRMANKPGLTIHNNTRTTRSSINSSSAQDPPESTTTDTQAQNNSYLMVANPINEQDEATARLGLPKAEEYDPEANSRTNTTRNQNDDLSSSKKALYVGAFLVVVVAAIALVILLVLALPKEETASSSSNTHHTEHDNNHTTTTITITPTVAPTTSTTEEMTLPEYVLHLLPHHTQQQIQQDNTSAQALAFDWVLQDLHNDNDYSDERIQQRFALATLYHATAGPSWSSNAHWLDHSVHECHWHTMASFALKDTLQYVYPGFLQEFFPPSAAPPTTCNDQGLFQHLWLDQNNLVGSLPEELYLLTHLQTLSMGVNRLQGTISTRIGQLTALEGLALYFFQAKPGSSSTVPTEIGLLSNLRGIGLNDNHHSGTLPTQLWKLTQLSTIITSRNPQLHFQIPTEIGLFSQLRWLNVDDCNIGGTLPTELGLVKSLEWNAMGGNQISGFIPSELGLLTNLRQASYYGNQFHGTIPTEIGQMTSLNLLSFRANALLTGTVPSELGQLTSLTFSLNLQDNPHLSGTLPTTLGRLTNLQKLSVVNNNHSGPLFTELGYLTALQRLNVANNSFTGTIPEELSALQSSLYAVGLQGNTRLSGTVPPALCRLNGTCAVTALIDCGTTSGLVFDCTSLLCGCGCTSCGEDGMANNETSTTILLPQG